MVQCLVNERISIKLSLILSLINRRLKSFSTFLFRYFLVSYSIWALNFFFFVDQGKGDEGKMNFIISKFNCLKIIFRNLNQIQI